MHDGNPCNQTQSTWRHTLFQGRLGLSYGQCGQQTASSPQLLHLAGSYLLILSQPVTEQDVARRSQAKQSHSDRQYMSPHSVSMSTSEDTTHGSRKMTPHCTVGNALLKFLQPRSCLCSLEISETRLCWAVSPQLDSLSFPVRAFHQTTAVQESRPEEQQSDFHSRPRSMSQP